MKALPPQRALKFLRWFCREDYIEEIEGDLVELHEKRYDRLSPKKANWHFVWDVLRSFRPENIKTLKGVNPNIPMLQHYLKIGSRNLLKSKVYSFTNVTGLTIGITCCLILLIFVRYESSFDNFHPHSDETYRVVQHTKFPDQTLYWNTTAYPLTEALRNDFSEFELVTQSAGPFRRIFSVENEDDRFESGYVLFVDPFYPRVFNLNWVSGNQDAAFQHTGSIVLTESVAKKCFSDFVINPESVLGRTILLNGKDPLLVTGVVKDAPGNTNLRYEILIPYEFFRQNNPYPANNWSGNYQGTTFVVLPDKVHKENIESSIAAWKKKHLIPDDDKRISYFLQHLKEIHTETLYGSSPGGYTMPTNILNAASYVGVFILLIAIANFINLVTAKSAVRYKEVGVRKIIGSTWSDLFRQFTLENAIVVVITIFLAVSLTSVLMNHLNVFLSRINLQLELRWSDAGLVLLLGSLTIVLATVYPAVVLSSYKPIQILKNNIVAGRTRNFTLRKSLIVFQFVIVQLFVIAAIIVALQMNYFKNKELGFSPDAVVMIPVPDFQKLDGFRNSLMLQKDILDVSIGSGPPMAVNGFALGTLFRIPNQLAELGQEAEMKIGDLNYLDFYDLELIAGRNFSANKPLFDEFIVNERVLKSLGWTPEEAIGRRLVINEGEATIIGVTRDYHNTSLQNDITPCIIMNWNSFLDQAFVRVKNINPDVLHLIEKAWKENFAASVFRYDFLDDSIENEYFIENLSFKGFTIFSVLVIVIGCLGLFGLMTFITLRRTKEVGIRKVLGASVLQITLFFSKEYMALIAVAFLIAVPFVYYFIQVWLDGFVYRIDLSAWMFLGGGIITLIIAIATSGFQAIKAAVANPVDSLRGE